MKIAFSRGDSSILGQWWWQIDRYLLLCFLLLMSAGMLLVASASVPVAERIGLSSHHFTMRHIFYLCVGLTVMVSVSFFNIKWVRRFAFLGLLFGIGLLFMVLVAGTEIKGATRWINLMGVNLQPVELVKPCFIIISAWLISINLEFRYFKGTLVAVLLFLLCVGLLLLQPDVGQSLLLAIVFGGQLFISGLPFITFFMLLIGGISALLSAYFIFPHVRSRIDRFLDPDKGDTFQISQSVKAFQNGGWFGTGPGEGVVKYNIPDSHSDFIFAVAGEEYGLIFCFLILILFLFLTLRGYIHSTRTRHIFKQIAMAGLTMQIFVQMAVNILSTMNLIPTKGMTLPFISYGGSSLVTLSFVAGVMLCLSKRSNDGI